MTLLEIVAALLVLSALFGLVNHNWLRLPHTIGLVVMGLAASMILIGLESLWPQLRISEAVRPVLASIDFRTVFLDGFLAALLFAGAIHVDFAAMANQRWSILLLSTVGVALSTGIVGVLMWSVAGLTGVPLPLIWALVFGALISPTDPVAVLALLRQVRVPDLLKAKIAGESLLNDGVGVVLFSGLLAIAAGADHAGTTLDGWQIAGQLFREAIGGGVLGLAMGMIAFALLRSLDEHNIEVMITLALVSATYALALRMHVSGPIAVVAGGLLIGNHGARFAMSQNTQEHLFSFWELIDELLNSLLFLLIGLNLFQIGASAQYFRLALAAIPIVLVARLISVAIPIAALRPFSDFSRGTIRILTWSGLRGGISVALALSLPDGPYRGTLLGAAYVVVVFSIIVQGLTMKRLVGWIYPEAG